MNLIAAKRYNDARNASQQQQQNFTNWRSATGILADPTVAYNPLNSGWGPDAYSPPTDWYGPMVTAPQRIPNTFLSDASSAQEPAFQNTLLALTYNERCCGQKAGEVRCCQSKKNCSYCVKCGMHQFPMDAVASASTKFVTFY